MGISVEFNPELALRKGDIPAPIVEGETYSFVKQGLRNYWLEGEIPLVETDGSGNLSRPLASIVILESTHMKERGVLVTKGRYLVKKVFDPSAPTVHFEGFTRRSS